MRLRQVATAMMALSFLLLAASFVLLFAGLDARRPAGTWAWRGTGALVPAISTFVGGVVVRRRPRNAVAWIFLACGVAFAAIQFADEWATNSLRGGIALPGGNWAAWLIHWGWILPMGGLGVHAMLLFPNGQLPSRRWRPVAVAGAVVVGVAAAMNALEDVPTEGFGTANPVAMISVGEDLVGMVLGLMIIFIVLAQLSLLSRRRRASSDEGAQIRWVQAGVLLLAITLVISVTPLGGDHTGSFRSKATETLVFVALAAIPLAAGVAILRYRLYDIDVVISRAFVVAGLAAFVTLLYAAVVAGLGAVVGRGDGAGGGLRSVAATAVVAVAFQPVRQRLRALADHIVYGARLTPYEVLADVAGQAATVGDAGAVLERLAKVLADATTADRVTLWLRVRDELRVEAEWPPGSRGPASVHGITQVEGSFVQPVSHEDELLGAIALHARRGETIGEGDERLTRDVAVQAALVLRNLGLTAELLQRVDELRSSRQRLVAAQDEERRRIERDLHDGAQQQLVAVRVQLGLARLTADDEGAAQTRAIIEATSSALGEALETLRDLARGIYPPMLAADGLVVALKTHAAKSALPVEVVGDAGRHDRDLESAVYFCCLEALQNIAKYADAGSVKVELAEHGGELEFSVTDNGRGFDLSNTTMGAGLSNMRDRIDALSGRLEISSEVGVGTRVEGRLPVSRRVSTGATPG